MDKKTFISELKQALSVLQEEELNDIISEYEQHIDMKQKNGLSEEEAIADFGSLSELAADILAAYHVRADYAKKTRKKAAFPDQEKAGRFRQQAGQIGTKVKSGALGGIHGLGSLLHRLWIFLQSLAGKPAAYIKNRCRERPDMPEGLPPDVLFLEMGEQEPGDAANGSSPAKTPGTFVSRRRRTAEGVLGLEDGFVGDAHGMERLLPDVCVIQWVLRPFQPVHARYAGSAFGAGIPAGRCDPGLPGAGAMLFFRRRAGHNPIEEKERTTCIRLRKFWGQFF